MASEHVAVPVRKWLRPLVLGVGVAGAVFAFSLAAIFQPSLRRVARSRSVTPTRVRPSSRRSAPSCHGAGGTGGVGPALAGSGIDVAVVESTVEQGTGVMPAGLVAGDDLADVLAYVEQIASSG